jgi:hypothetical protein
MSIYSDTKTEMLSKPSGLVRKALGKVFILQLIAEKSSALVEKRPFLCRLSYFQIGDFMWRKAAERN